MLVWRLQSPLSCPCCWAAFRREFALAVGGSIGGATRPIPVPATTRMPAIKQPFTPYAKLAAMDESSRHKECMVLKGNIHHLSLRP